MSEPKAYKIKTVPDNYTAVTPWLISPSTVKTIAFLTGVFDAEEVAGSRITNDEGIIIHVVVKIGNAMLMLFDARDGWGPTPGFFNLYVDDIEKTYQKAISSGATSVTDITALYFGEKVCRVLDPFGNLWWINERTEEVDFTDPEIAGRANTPEAVASIVYIQKSLNEALLAQKKFFN